MKVKFRYLPENTEEGHGNKLGKDKPIMWPGIEMNT
jgi:hypothetical protein